jgi:C-terminal processing protease CtpA/Prc
VRALGLLAGLTFLIAACSGTPTATTAPSPTPTASVDIKRAKLDITYSHLSANDVHKVSSKKVLEGAVAALNAEINKTGGKGEIAMIEFQDTTDQVFADFKRFAEAAAVAKALNPQITADRYADVAIEGMIGASPDCHTYYVDKAGGVHRSRPEPARGQTARIPSTGTALGGPDEAGLTGRILPGGIVYITFNQFILTANYKIFDEVRKMLDKGLAAGGKAWLFDFRGNVGGDSGAVDQISSFFLNGEKMLQLIFRAGAPVTNSARREWRLPDAYQLPMVVLLNDRGGSGPEVVAASLKENKRATIVGSKSIGCMGSFNPTTMTDGSRLAVVVHELVGAQTGTIYNNIGVLPDVQADDATAVDRAIEILKAKI